MRTTRTPRHERFRARGVLVAIGRGRRAETRVEGACEGLVGLIAGIEGDLGHRIGGGFQLLRGALQPQPAYILLHRLARHATEDAVEVERREARHPGEVLEREFLVEVALDVEHDAEDAFLVAHAALRTGWRMMVFSFSGATRRGSER